MNVTIDSPTRAHALEALRAREAACLRQGNLREAEQVRQDLDILARETRGETLYDIHCAAKDRYEHAHPRSETWAGVGLFGGFLGAMVAAPALIHFGVPVAIAVGGVGALIGGAFVNAVRLHRQARWDEQVLRVIRMHESYIRRFEPEAAPPTVRRDVFLDALRAREATLAGQSRYDSAREIARLHERMSRLEGDTMEALFQSARSDKELIALVERFSDELAETVSDLQKVARLAAGGDPAAVAESAESVTVGGVTLKKRAAWPSRPLAMATG